MTRAIPSLAALAAVVGLTTANAQAQASKATDDAQILGWLIALNENEVGAATMAEQKAAITGQGRISEEVVAYARMLHVQHAKGAQDTKDLAVKMSVVPVEGPEIGQMRTRARQDQAKIAPLPAREFERAFVQQMADGHRAALAKVESYQKAAQRDALKQHLGATRERVALHLAEAERLQSSVAR